MPDIFLSYNREDQAVARRFAEAFGAEGFEVWWDATLKSGEAYDEVTETALRTAKAVVVLWSPRSVVSRWVRAEATLADRNKTLVPCTIEPCDRPIMFELTQTAELSHWQGDPTDKAWTAFLTDVTLPSGDKENFLGTGDLRLRAAFIASVSGKRFSPHLNLGYEWNSGTTELSNVDYRGGLEVMASPRLTLAADIVGTVFPSAGDQFRARALDGQSLIGRSVIDGAIGVKWAVNGRSVLVLNLLVPMNDAGIRPGSAITLGLQIGS